MKRYIVCKTYGNGGDPDIKPWTPTTGPYRPAIADVVNPQTGNRAFSFTAQMNPASKPWCLVVATGQDFTLLNNNADCDVAPDLALDAKLSTLPTNVRNAIFTKLQNRGIDLSTISNNDAYRLLIRLLGRLQDQAFSEDKFDNVE